LTAFLVFLCVCRGGQFFTDNFSRWTVLHFIVSLASGDKHDRKTTANNGFNKWQMTSNLNVFCFLFSLLRLDSDERFSRHIRQAPTVMGKFKTKTSLQKPKG